MLPKNYIPTFVCIACFVVTVYVLLGIVRPGGYRQADAIVCRSNIAMLAARLNVYAEANGCMPSWRSWPESLVDSYTGAEQTDLKRWLRCPCDVSREQCSYAMNSGLSGVRVADIPRPRWKHVVLLRERKHGGSHGWIVYLDGHYEKARQ